MVHLQNLASSLRMSAVLTYSPKDYDYDELFRSPVTSGMNSSSAPAPAPASAPVEPTPLSLLDCGNDYPEDDFITLRNDTRGAALLLASIKKLATDETLDDTTCTSSVSTKELTLAVPKLHKRNPTPPPCGVKKINVHGNCAHKLTTLKADCIQKRIRAVSVDSLFLDGNSHCSTFSTDALPREQISLDLTSDQNNDDSCNGITTKSLVPQISPPNSPCLSSVNSPIRKGPRGLIKKKRQIEPSKPCNEPIPKKKKLKDLSSALRTVDEKSQETENKQVLRKKFSWKSYPELEDFLIANREEYLMHSAMNYTTQQKEYNNRLTERLLELAAECGYVFDKSCFSFVSIRDRIRCYFKSYVQSKKKRGLILGYAARKKGLITEEELAGTKGIIVHPKSAQKNA